MGTRTAPSYANIFMADLENKLLDNSPNNLQPLIWKRYIDDIFVVWTHGEESLHTFINHLNTSHPSIHTRTYTSWTQQSPSRNKAHL